MCNHRQGHTTLKKEKGIARSSKVKLDRKRRPKKLVTSKRILDTGPSE